MITVQALNGTFTCYDNDWIVREIQECGIFSRPELGMITRFLKPGDTVLDVGAHIGTFSVPIKKAVGEQGRLFAFEANPDTFALLQKNFADNDVQAEAFNKGVAAKSGALYLKGRKLKERNQNTNDNDEPLNSGADHLVESSGNNEGLIKVDLVKIDDVVPGPIHFIKIDVEGMELSVLQSATKKINEFRPLVYSEYFRHYLKRAGANPQDYEDFFKTRNYHFFINGYTRKASNDEFKLVRIPSPKYIRGQVDFLLIPADSERYPTQFSDWKNYKPHKFLWNRFRNFLGVLKFGLKP